MKTHKMQTKYFTFCGIDTYGCTARLSNNLRGRKEECTCKRCNKSYNKYLEKIWKQSKNEN